MQYNLQLDRDADAEIVVKQLTAVSKNSKLPLTLFGQGRPNYGQDLQNNFFYLLENFCGEDAPLNATVGMLWYDSALKYLKLYTGESYPRGPWVKVDMISSLTSPPSPPPLAAAKTITWTSNGFFESTTNNGEVIGYLWAEIAGTTYKPNLVNGTDYVITNVPTGLKPKVSSTDTNVVFSFTGSAPSYSENTATFKVEFNSSAFVGVSGNVADLIGNYSHESIITFIPPSTIVPKIINSFEKISYITLKDISNNVYDIFIDTYNYGSYIIYDSTKAITSTGSLIDVNNALGAYKCTTIANDLVISTDNISFSQVMQLPPRSVGVVEYKLIKYSIAPDGTLYASIDNSLSDITIDVNTKKIDDTGYIVGTIPNGINAQQVKIYNSTTKQTTTYPTNALLQVDTAILDSPNKGYNYNTKNFISKNSDYVVTFTGINISGMTINYNMSNKGSHKRNITGLLKYKSNANLPKQHVAFTQIDYTLNIQLLDSTGQALYKTLLTDSDDNTFTVADERVPTYQRYTKVIVDVLYNGQNSTNTADVYTVITMNNNKKVPYGYMINTVEVKNTVSTASDITIPANIGESLFFNNSLTYQTTANSKILYKVFVNAITGTTGLFYQG
jgi:hypothetical protein